MPMFYYFSVGKREMQSTPAASVSVKGQQEIWLLVDQEGDPIIYETYTSIGEADMSRRKGLKAAADTVTRLIWARARRAMVTESGNEEGKIIDIF